jgi:hypothetical protein
LQVVGRDVGEPLQLAIAGLEIRRHLIERAHERSELVVGRDLRGLNAFLGEYPDGAPFGVVLYAGQEWMRPARNVVAIPWSALLGS